MKVVLRAAVAVLAGGLVLSGCSGASDTKVATGFGSGSGADLLPSETLRDGVSYADTIVVATATAERDGAGVGDPGGGPTYFSRKVTFTVDRVLWAAPGQRAPESLEFDTVGYSESDGERTEVRRHDVPWYALREQYILPLTRDSMGKRNVLAGNSILPLNPNATFADGRPWVPPTPAARALVAASPAENAQLLARTQPDPTARKYWNLSPKERWAKVSQQQVAAESPS